MKTAEATSVEVRADCVRETGRLACAEKCRIVWPMIAEDILRSGRLPLQLQVVRCVCGKL